MKIPGQFFIYCRNLHEEVESNGKHVYREGRKMFYFSQIANN